MKVSEIAQPGKLRQILAFELRMNIIADATIDLLFTKNRVNNENLPGKQFVYCVHCAFWLCIFLFVSGVYYRTMVLKVKRLLV